MCQLWFPFQNSGIIFTPAHRYNLGRCTKESWSELNKQLKILYKYKHNTIGAMSRYDVEYLRYYTGLNPTLTPGFGGFYISAKYSKPKKKNFLIFTVYQRTNNFIREVQETLKPELSANFIHDVYKFYHSEDLTNHPAIISLPYSVISYRLVELYAMGIPIFIPSVPFFINFTDTDRGRNGIGWDRTSTSHPYCNIDPHLEEKMRPSPDSGYSTHPYRYMPNIQISCKNSCSYKMNIKLLLIG